DDGEILQKRGEVYRLLQDFEKALNDFSKVIKIVPKCVYALARRGEIYRMTRKDNQAITDLDEAINLDPNNLMARESRGAVYRALKLNTKALLDLNRALENVKDKAYNIDNETKALCNRGAVYNALGKYNEALVDLNRVLIRDPKNVVAISELIAAYDAMGKKESALVDLENVLAIDPKNVFALRKYEILRKETEIAENSTTLKKIHRTTDSDDIQFSVLTPVRGNNKSNFWSDTNFVEISKFGSVYQNISSGTSTTAHNKIERLFSLLEKQKDAIYHILDSQKVYVYAVELGFQQDYLMPCITCWVDKHLDKSVIEKISALFNNEYKIMDKVVGPVETDLNVQHDDDKVNSCDDNKGSDRND
ncbi:7930_t:CDS:2, partial [Cetraspora pellucida]